ncbi:MAG: hypothetical protein KAV01_01455 [Candidatus Lokiarchaeota archaeon]|nr:hypothetical protein [Candidatus Lokiarchaeota archaeon]MCK4479167.1 hypothetical protein [Candidatus Lokiarchaeota archaeon]
MNNKFSPEIQAEINDIISKIQNWKNFFNYKIEFYFDGWAIFLREKNAYPRYITIFKSYKTCTFSIKSFEVYLKDFQKEEFKELYFIDNISTKNDLLKELKDIIYGKDLIQEASKLYNNTFLN